MMLLELRYVQYIKWYLLFVDLLDIEHIEHWTRVQSVIFIFRTLTIPIYLLYYNII